jgi:hypothetical protein
VEDGMYAIATQPRNAGAILEAAVALCRAAFPSQLILAGTATALAYLPLLALTYSGAATDVFMLLNLIMSMRALLAGLVLALACAALYAAMLTRMEAVALGKQMSLAEAMASAVRHLPQVLIASALFLLIVTLGSIVVIPGIIFFQSMMFYLPAIMLDDKDATSSLAYSHTLVWGLWWRTAAVWGAGLLISTVLVYIGAAAGLVVSVLPIDLSALALIEILAQALMTLVITPFLIALWLELYRDLKLRKEGQGRHEATLAEHLRKA